MNFNILTNMINFLKNLDIFNNYISTVGFIIAVLFLTALLLKQYKPKFLYNILAFFSKNDEPKLKDEHFSFKELQKFMNETKNKDE